MTRQENELQERFDKRRKRTRVQIGKAWRWFRGLPKEEPENKKPQVTFALSNRDYLDALSGGIIPLELVRKSLMLGLAGEFGFIVRQFGNPPVYVKPGDFTPSLDADIRLSNSCFSVDDHTARIIDRYSHSSQDWIDRAARFYSIAPALDLFITIGERQAVPLSMNLVEHKLEEIGRIPHLTVKDERMLTIPRATSADRKFL